jgi:hypothetical protein
MLAVIEKMSTMKKLNDFTYQEIYDKIQSKESFEFIASRTEIGFENIENEFTTINFDIPFRLPLLNNLENLVDFIIRESIGQINIDFKDRIKILTEIYGGAIFYQRFDSEGKEWKVMVIFQAQKE